LTPYFLIKSHVAEAKALKAATSGTRTPIENCNFEYACPILFVRFENKKFTTKIPALDTNRTFLNNRKI